MVIVMGACAGVAVAQAAAALTRKGARPCPPRDASGASPAVAGIASRAAAARGTPRRRRRWAGIPVCIDGGGPPRHTPPGDHAHEKGAAEAAPFCRASLSAACYGAV